MSADRTEGGLSAAGSEIECRLESFTAIREQWKALYSGDPRATPFSSPEWAQAWLEHWLGSARPYILAFREQDALVGIAPLVLQRRGPARVLTGLGGIVGNYWDVIASDARRRRVTAAFAAALRQRSREWDRLVLDRLTPESPTIGALEGAGLQVRHRRPNRAPELPLVHTFDDYLASLSANRRSKVKRYLRPLEQGQVRLVAIEDPAGLARSIAAWQRLRVHWWRHRARAMNPEHASERFLRFTQQAVTAMVPTGLALVWEFHRAEDLIGVAINFIDRRRFYYWLGGFDPRFESLRLGHMVIAASIRHSIESKLDFYDFMIGEEAYKYDYGATDRLLPWITAANSRPRSRAVAAAAARGNRASRTMQE